MAKPRLEAVLFDIDDTLYSTTEFARRARLNSIEEMIRQGLRIDRGRCYAELLEVISEFSSNYEQHYDKLLSRLPKSAVGGLNPAVLIAAAVVGYHRTKERELKPYRDVIGALRSLSRRGLALGIVSAGLAVKQAEKLIRLDVTRLLDRRAVFISEQVGIGKPNPKLYLNACRRMGVSPARTMYVGDDPRMDVDAANRAGLIAVRIRRGGRHDAETGETPAAHEIRSLAELVRIVDRTYLTRRR